MLILEEFLFGYDTEDIRQLEQFLSKNFIEGKDYKRFVGHGDDVMNALEVYAQEILLDDEFNDLLDSCEGSGHY